MSSDNQPRGRKWFRISAIVLMLVLASILWLGCCATSCKKTALQQPQNETFYCGTTKDMESKETAPGD